MNDHQHNEQQLGVEHERLAPARGNRTVVTITSIAEVNISRAFASISKIANICAEVWGPVAISEIIIRWKATKEGQCLEFATSTSAKVMTRDTYMQVPNSGGCTATSFNYGVWHEFRPSVPAGLANQISPPSADYPPASIFLYSSDGAQIAVDFWLTIGGDRHVVSQGF